MTPQPSDQEEADDAGEDRIWRMRRTASHGIEHALFERRDALERRSVEPEKRVRPLIYRCALGLRLLNRAVRDLRAVGRWTRTGFKNVCSVRL